MLVPASVEVRPYTGPGWDGMEGHFVVSPVWDGVDRPNVGGIVAPAELVGRLVLAYMSGKAFHSAVVRVDVGGQTYVSAQSYLSARWLRSDLDNLGM